MPDLVVRRLEPDDLEAAWQLGRHAFGGPAEPPARALETPPDLTRWGAFDASGALVGKAVDLHHDQWWGGRLVRAADVGGVAVAPEARSRGIARALLTALLTGARERGAAVSALYPTTSAPYRALGWEVVGTLRTVELRTAEVQLAAGRAPGGLVLRAGTPSDAERVGAVYTALAREGNGLLARTSSAHRTGPGQLPGDADGLTLVEGTGGALRGYASWRRGEGYGDDGVLPVDDALALDADAAQALAVSLGSWASVTPTLRLPEVPGGPLDAVLPVERLREHEVERWMHRPVDVTAAVAGRGWPDHVAGTATFRLVDPVAPWNDGCWRLRVDEGRGELSAYDGQPEAVLGTRAFAALSCGAVSGAVLRHAGLLDAPSPTDASALDLLAATPQAALLDYF